MNILIYTVNPQSPHMAVDLELAYRFKERGDKVTIVRCTGQLKSCLDNPRHNMLMCMACNSKYNTAIKLAGLTGVDMITLPSSSSSYEFLPKTFENIEQLKAYKFRGSEAGIAVASTLIGRFNKDHRFDTRKYHQEVFRELQMWVDTYLGLEKILQEVKPDEVYFFNGRFSTHHPLRSLCIQNNITYYTHERAGVINKYIVRKNTMPHDIDYTIQEINQLWQTASDNKEEVGAKFFTDRRNNVVQSWLPFTEFQKKGLLPPTFDQNKKNIVIFNSTMEEYEGMESWKNPLYADDNDGLRSILHSFKDQPEYVFYLRVHPNLKLLENTQIKEIRLMAEEFKNLYVINPEETYDSYALMDYADKVVTFGSTIGVEATFWNKASILLGKSMYMNIDACYQPLSHEEAVSLIKINNLPSKNKINAIKYGYWELMKGDYFKTFKQVDLFNVSCEDQVIQANRTLRLFEKFSKLFLIRNRRDLDNVKKKLKKMVGWK